MKDDLIVYDVTFINASLDDEANALRAAIEIINKLPTDEARDRVVSYLAQRYR
jgi:hypothetical protein